MFNHKILRPICKAAKDQGYTIFRYFSWKVTFVKDFSRPKVSNAYCQFIKPIGLGVPLTYHAVIRKYCVQAQKAKQEKNIKTSDKENNLFGTTKVEELSKSLNQSVRFMFVTSYDYSLLHKDVVLESNFFGTNHICRGILSYAIQLMKIRFHLHFRYPDVSVSTEDAVLLQSNELIIRIPWKLSAVPQRHVVKFWRFLKKQNAIFDSDLIIIKGFSDFHIGSDGSVQKHRLNRAQQNQESQPSDQKVLE